MGSFRGGLLLPHPPVLLPEVGGAESEKAARTKRAAEQAAKISLKHPVETVVLMTPHAPRFSDAIAVFDYPYWEGSLAQFGAPDVRLAFEADRELAQRILAAAQKVGAPVVRVTPEEARRRQWPHGLDHGAMVPLSFLAKAGFRGKLVLLSPGDNGYEAFAQCGRLVRKAIEETGRPTLVVASGDLSHCVSSASPYGKRPEGARFDQAVQSAIEHNSFDELLGPAADLADAAGECGFRPLCFLFGAVDDAASTLFSYEAPFGIGYAVAAWRPKEVAT